LSSPRLPGRRPPRRPAKRRREIPLEQFLSSPSSSPSSRPAPRTSSSLSLDAQRYAAFRAGVSEEELASRENVLVSTIKRSIEKMEVERETYSHEQVELTNRRTLIRAAEARETSLLQMLVATREKLIHEEGDPSRPKYVEMPDHDIQLKAMAALDKLIESIQTAAPLVSVSQQNNLQQNFNPGVGGLSTESIIRRVREERGLAIPAEIIQTADGEEVPLPDTIDFELQEELAESGNEDEAAEED
jgi:hypothetical protein